MLSEFPFAAFLSYTPRPESDIQRRSKDVMYWLKGDLVVPSLGVPFSTWVARQVKERLADLPFRALFPGTAVIVPTPRTALIEEGTLWVPLNLARAFVAAGLGASVLTCLERTESLTKAATAATDKRPRASDHFRTLRVQGRVEVPSTIVLLDDVITSGATMLGAASRLREAFPRADIYGFAALRAISNAAEFRAIEDPCVGQIVLRPSGLTRRVP